MGITLNYDNKDKIYVDGKLYDKEYLKEYTSNSKITDLKRYSKDGVKSIEGFTDKDNLIIKGENLKVLYKLLDTFKGKVKLIYIDPPYNTGKNRKYKDNYTREDWLTFMKNRFEVARELLREDGAIFVQCDDNEQAYLKVLMDEVFGKENFISTIIWKGKRGGQDSKYVAKAHEFILLYSKNNSSLKLNKMVIEDNSNYNKKDEEGNYKLQLLRKCGSNSKRSDRPNLFYPVKIDDKEICPILPNGEDGRWRRSKERMNKALENNIVTYIERDNRIELYEKIYESNGLKEIVFPSIIDESFAGQGIKSIEGIFGDKVFAYPKPEQLIKKLIELGTNPGDIVLDYHLGSGTTCAVAHKMGRQYIGIEQMDYIETIPVERLKKVIIEGEQGGISKDVEWKGGGNFIYGIIE